MKITFLNTEIELEFANYRNNNNVAIEAVEVETGDPFMTVTTNVEKLADDEVAIKNHSENKGILDVLIKEGIVSEPIDMLPSGWVSIPVCKLLRRE